MAEDAPPYDAHANEILQAYSKKNESSSLSPYDTDTNQILEAYVKTMNHFLYHHALGPYVEDVNRWKHIR